MEFKKASLKEIIVYKIKWFLNLLNELVQKIKKIDLKRWRNVTPKRNYENKRKYF